jgi:hypothetical protein
VTLRRHDQIHVAERRADDLASFLDPASKAAAAEA